MKKFISSILILAMASIGASSAFAWVPTDLDDPKCINLKNFGNGPQKIVKGRKFCGCKTCEFTAITYDKLDDYLYGVISDLEDNDEAIIKFVKNSLTAEAFVEAAETVVLFTDSFREKLCSKFPKAGKKIIGAILAGGAVVGLISSIVENHYSSKALMEKNKLNNTKRVLRHMSSDIAAKNYKGGNYYFVSTNYGVGEADAIGTFAKKEGIKYNVEYDDTYFNKIKEHADNILKTIDDESFFKHSTYEYKESINNTIKTVKKIAIGADLLAKGVSLAKKHGWDLNKIKEWLKKQGETEDLDEKAESIKELTDSDYIDVLSNSEKNNEKFKELQSEKIKLDVPNVSLPTATPAA